MEDIAPQWAKLQTVGNNPTLSLILNGTTFTALPQFYQIIFLPMADLGQRQTTKTTEAETDFTFKSNVQ